MPAFEEVKDIDQLEYEGKTWNGLIGRTLAMRPGGPFCGRFLAHYSTLLIVGKSLFVHGGVRQENLSNGIEDIVMYNREVSQWVKGLCEDYDPPYIVTSGGHGIKNTAVTWNREYGLYKNIPCDSLANTLEKVKCSRMMIGHTIQGPLGINAVCKGAVVRIDVGMSKGCGNREPQALEILDDERLNVISRKGTKPLDVTAASTALDPPSDPNEDTSVNTTGTRMKITPSK
ncbi:hypothetical protein Mapa_008767 [Marchantia paleacea]|nr:hypothetical protein Mapa_008767 [Marchantia paleacea]